MISDDVVTETPKKAPTKNEIKANVVTEPQKKEACLDDVRAVLAEKTRKDHTVVLRELLIKHGVSNFILSNVIVMDNYNDHFDDPKDWVTAEDVAKHADNSIPDSSEEWLDNFNTFSIYQVLPQLIRL